MKKFLAVILTIVVVFSLCACGTDDSTSSDSTASDEPVSNNLNLVSADASGKINSYEFSAEPSETNVFLPIGESFTLGGKSYTLSFFDDFNGTDLDPLKWARCKESTRQDYKGKWDNDMSWVDGKGFLHIGVAQDEDGTLISGAVHTRTLDNQILFAQKRGYFEIKCKPQKATGCWSAFWLMSDIEDVKKVGNGAIDGAEIDVFESFDPKNGVVNHAVHCDGYGDNHKATGVTTQNPNLYDGNFHTFALLWDENGYYFYIDGVMTQKFDNTQDDFLGSCEIETYMKITAEFGSWGGYVNLSLMPDALVVDYVRVYKED